MSELELNAHPAGAGADKPSGIAVRWLTEHDWPHAYPLMHALRTLLSEAEFLRRMGVQVPLGYRLAAAFEGAADSGTIVGLLGVRTVASLSRGLYLHVDDLVVSEAAKRGGVGSLLMRFAEDYARAEGMQAVFLDSRPSATAFYSKLGYTLHPSPSMWKSLV